MALWGVVTYYNAQAHEMSTTVSVSDETMEKIEAIQENLPYDVDKKSVVAKAIDELHQAEIESSDNQTEATEP